MLVVGDIKGASSVFKWMNPAFVIVLLLLQFGRSVGGCRFDINLKLNQKTLDQSKN